jgi:hypothetical protein
LLLAGVAASALMGVGLGLWARPAMNERRLSIAAFEAPMTGPARMLQIVVGEAPAPLGAPIEVLPASRAAPAAPAPERTAPEPVAPVRPPAGLVRVQAVEPEPEPEPVEVAPPPKPKPKPPLQAAPVKSVKVKVAAPPKTAPKPVQLVKVKQVEKAKRVEKPEPAKATPAKTVQKPAPPKVRLIKSEVRQKPLHMEKTIEKKPPKAAPPVHVVAHTPPAGPVHVVAHTPPRKVEPAAKVQKVTLERKTPKPTPAVKAVKQAKPAKQLKPALAAKPPAEKVAIKAKPPAKAAPPKAIRPARGAGPVRVAKAAPRPDSTISDADRQMNRAYSSARAAGVPDWQLRRQQQRWEQARAAAAREAPWAVHDVYLARIAQLHDLTRNAEDPDD